MHGYGVLLRIEQITWRAGDPAGRHPALYRLEHQGRIAGEWGTSDNRRAKFYHLTRDGRMRRRAGTGLLTL